MSKLGEVAKSEEKLEGGVRPLMRQSHRRAKVMRRTNSEQAMEARGRNENARAAQSQAEMPQELFYVKVKAPGGYCRVAKSKLYHL